MKKIIFISMLVVSLLSARQVYLETDKAIFFFALCHHCGGDVSRHAWSGGL